MQTLDSRPWWPDLIALKDNLSLRELAVKFEVSPAAISNALKRNGINRTAAPAGPRSSRPEAHKTAAAAAIQSTTKRGPPAGWVAAAPAQEQQEKAYKVVFSELELQLKARDLVHAAEIAQRIADEGVVSPVLTLTVKLIESI